MIAETGIYLFIERNIGYPNERYCKQWLKFYDNLSKNNEINKMWIVCVEHTYLNRNKESFLSTLNYMNERKFKTMYCDPIKLKRSFNMKRYDYQTIEHFGKYIKLLCLVDGKYGNELTSGELKTIFRVSDTLDKQLRATIETMSVPIDDNWINENIKNNKSLMDRILG